jgi:hypothetical protein
MIPTIGPVAEGFRDADAWIRRTDGTIVARARDRSYKEIARGGMPIEALISQEAIPEVESCIIPSAGCGVAPAQSSWLSPPNPVPAPTASVWDGCHSPIFEWVCGMPILVWCACLEYDNIGEDVDYPHEDDGYFTYVEYEDVYGRTEYREPKSRRAGRTAKKPATKPHKVSKYGPKASKAHTVAARFHAEPAPPSVLVDKGVPRCECCGVYQSAEGYENLVTLVLTRPCQHCSPKWIAEHADYVEAEQANRAELMRYQEELRREKFYESHRRYPY